MVEGIKSSCIPKDKASNDNDDDNKVVVKYSSNRHKSIKHEETRTQLCYNIFPLFFMGLNLN